MEAISEETSEMEEMTLGTTATAGITTKTTTGTAATIKMGLTKITGTTT